MPILDVSVALTSPHLFDKFIVNRRQEGVGTNGRSVTTIVPFNPVYGVVYANNGKLHREKDSDEQDKYITIITRFALRGASIDGVPQAYKPDIVIWHGNQYIVEDMKDYSGYGLGFVEAECCMLDTTAQPPTENVAP